MSARKRRAALAKPPAQGNAKSVDPEAAAALARKKREEACVADFAALLERHNCDWAVRQQFLNGRLEGNQIVFVAKVG